MGLERVLAAAIPMFGASEALATLGAYLRSRDDDCQVEPAFAARLAAVLDALGVRDEVDALGEHEAHGLAAMVEGLLAQSADFAVQPDRDGWNHDTPSILMAQGRMSALLAPTFQRHVVPSLGGGLEDRLNGDGASFLDIGAGVAALSVAMCRIWPSLRVVAVDPWEPALALAREHIAQSGMAERVELRESTAEALQDSQQYDLAWVPTFFISGAVLEPIIERVREALRTDGSAIFGLYVRPDNPLATALADLRTARHGGALLTPQELASALTKAGFDDVEVRFDPAWGSPIIFVTGRRP